jgi:ribosomal protein L15
MTPQYATNTWDVQIKQIKEGVGAGASGQIENQVQVQFMVGAHGPFTQNFPKAGFDPVKAKAELTEFAQKLQQLSAAPY